MTVRDSLIGFLAPQIGEARAIHLLNDFVVSATVGSRSSREEHRMEVLAEEARTPLVVRRFDSSLEPALEDERPELLVCCIAEDGRPVALLLDDEARAKLAGLLGLGKGTGTTGEPTPADFYQPGQTYHGNFDWAFRCDMVTAHPEDGELTALGWRFWNDEWNPYAYHQDDWETDQARLRLDATGGAR